MANDEDTPTLEIAGRRIAFRRPSPGQLVMLMRLTNRAQSSLRSEDDDNAVSRIWIDLSVKILDVIDSLIINDDDRIFLEDKMISGEIDIDHLRPVIGGTVAAPDDEDAPAAIRAPKKVAKKTVKKAATRKATKKNRA